MGLHREIDDNNLKDFNVIFSVYPEFETIYISSSDQIRNQFTLNILEIN